MYLIRPPITGDPQLDSWTDKITNSINQGLFPGAAGTGASFGSPAGRDGEDGNSVIYLYTRTNSSGDVPTPPTSVIYDLATDPVTMMITGGSHTWESTPTEFTGSNKYLWVTFRYVAAKSGNITDANSWDTPVLLGVPGEDGEAAVSIRVQSFRLPANSTPSDVATAYDAETFDFATLRSSTSGFQFRNDSGEDKVLLTTVSIGSSDMSHADHYDLTYLWSKNGQAFTPNISGQNLTRRFLVINAQDVADGGEDVFQCTVTQS